MPTIGSAASAPDPEIAHFIQFEHIAGKGGGVGTVQVCAAVQFGIGQGGGIGLNTAKALSHKLCAVKGAGESLVDDGRVYAVGHVAHRLIGCDAVDVLYGIVDRGCIDQLAVLLNGETDDVGQAGTVHGTGKTGSL